VAQKKRAEMADYFLLILDSDGRVIRTTPSLVCANDAEAIDRALQELMGRAGELWQRNRLVTHLPVKGAPKES
jgi:hypothetical protein